MINNVVPNNNIFRIYFKIYLNENISLKIINKTRFVDYTKILVSVHIICILTLLNHHKFFFLLFYLQVVELSDALAVNSTSVRLDWQLHVSNTEEYIEVRFTLFE